MSLLKRYWSWVVIVILTILLSGVLFFEYFRLFIGAIFFCIIGEFVAIVLSELALWSYTKVDLTEYLLKGADNKYSPFERAEAIRFAGKVFVGVHILVGLIIAGVYFVYVS